MIIKNPRSFSRIYKAQRLYIGREVKTEEVWVMTKNSVRFKSRCEGNVGGDSDKMLWVMLENFNYYTFSKSSSFPNPNFNLLKIMRNTVH